MIKRRPTGALVALLTTLAVLWTLSAVGVAPPATTGGAAAPAVLLVRHSVQDGVHTYSGTFASPCPLGVSIATAGASAPRVVLALSEAHGQQCTATQARPQPFEASITAADPVLARVSFDGSPLLVRVVEQ